MRSSLCRRQGILAALAALLFFCGCNLNAIPVLLKMALSDKSGPRDELTYRSGAIAVFPMRGSLWISVYDKDGVENVQLFDENGRTLREYHSSGNGTGKDLYSMENGTLVWIRAADIGDGTYSIEALDGARNVLRHPFVKQGNVIIPRSYAGALD